MVDVPRLHLRLGVANPQHHRRRIDIEGALEDGARAAVLLLLELPLGVAHPIVHVDAVAADIVFELLAFPALEFVQLFEVGEALRRGLQAGFLTVDGFAEELLGADLDAGCLFVFDPGGAAGGLHGGRRELLIAVAGDVEGSGYGFSVVESQ